MLSGFQEAAQKIQDRDEYALVPLFRFYDTVHGFLDGSIRRVIERCAKAAEDGNGIEAYDVDVLKLLYLVRYIDDIKASIDNIVILMADDIRVDKITLREKVKASLDRLDSQNYIGRTGDTYNFLTDEEQDLSLIHILKFCDGKRKIDKRIICDMLFKVYLCIQTVVHFLWFYYT